MNDRDNTERRRFGIVAADPLRFLGLQMMFPEEAGVELVPLEGASGRCVEDLALVVVDASCTENLNDLLSAFQTRQPSVKLLVVGLQDDFTYIEGVIGAGAKGYLTHGASQAEIRLAIDIVLDGSVWAPRKVLAKLIERGMAQQQRSMEPLSLTPREKDVLRRLGAGSSNKEIASALTIDAPAVKAHVGRLMRKLGVSNRTALSVEATRRGLLN